MKTTLRKFTRFARAGFTLVELLIVVIILAILAAIVIPQFSNTAVQARESALDANLAALRAAIELYRSQHGVYPAVATAVGPACVAGAAAGTGAGTLITAPLTFIDQLTGFSTQAGQTCNGPQPAAALYRFGPYMRAIPNEPINNIGSAVGGIVTIDGGIPFTATTAAIVAGAGGWLYDRLSGQIVMNSLALDSRGAQYWTH